ncbi:MAG: hypothetical protein CBD97_01130 [Pelagibacteraceae bacterium TMED237]|nr:hypothetical protein [Candidatus Neomarinimicrobiota bacterium]OUW96669.1 MAG: hypothetical protein CBD97_01130 [Pelagibacteraceae bacterium TMED237]|tara:strand:+ start:318 stop:1211 length:894 start_codon:yes stop_codon:yes gene_type:complete
MTNKINISLVLLIALFAVSTSPIAAKLLNQNSEVNGIVIAFWRMAFASGLIWLFSIFKNQGNFIYRKNFNLTVISGMFLGLHFFFFFVALDLTKLSNAVFLGTITPLFTLILEIFFLNRKFKKEVFIGLFCALIGAFIILIGSPLDYRDNDMLGNLCAITCSIILAVSFLISEKVRQNENTIIYTRTLYTSAATTLLVISIFFSTNLVPLNNQLNLFLGFLFMGLVPTIIGHNAFYYSLKYVKPTIIASIPLGEPIIASIIGILLIPNQVFTTSWDYTIFGGFITLAGIFIVIKNKT